MGEQANKKKRESFLIQGKRPKAHLHVCIGRVNKESDETIIQSPLGAFSCKCRSSFEYGGDESFIVFVCWTWNL